MSLVLGLGLEHSCPWPREVLSSERLSLALASDFFGVLGLESCVLDFTSEYNDDLMEIEQQIGSEVCAIHEELQKTNESLHQLTQEIKRSYEI